MVLQGSFPVRTLRRKSFFESDLGPCLHRPGTRKKVKARSAKPKSNTVSKIAGDVAMTGRVLAILNDKATGTRAVKRKRPCGLQR